VVAETDSNYRQLQMNICDRFSLLEDPRTWQLQNEERAALPIFRQSSQSRYCLHNRYRDLLSYIQILGCSRGRRVNCSADQSRSVVGRCRCLTLAFFTVSTGLAVTLTPVIPLAITVTTVVLTIAYILHFTVTVNRAPGPVTVAAVVVTLPTVILARGSTAVATRRGAATAGGAVATCRDATVTAITTVTTVTAAVATGAIAARVESPRCWRRSAGPLVLVRWVLGVTEGRTYLNLQQVVSADALVVHLVISVIGIAATLVLDERKATVQWAPGSRRRKSIYSQARRRWTWGRDIAADKAAVTERALAMAGGGRQWTGDGRTGRGRSASWLVGAQTLGQAASSSATRAIARRAAKRTRRVG
jgi:hypothetical protein